MDSHKAAKKLTEEIIEEFRLPRDLCFKPIYTRFRMAIGVGIDIGITSLASGQKPVAKLDKNGIVLEVFASIRVASNAMGLKSKTTISQVCSGKGRNLTAAGFKWKYLNPDDYYKKRKMTDLINQD